MEVVARANELVAQGRDVISLCVGQPSAPAPKTAREAARMAIAAGKIGYTPARGIAPLRRRIAAHYLERYGAELDHERVIVTTGSSAGFMLSFLACFDPGDRVAIPSPGYPAYRNILRSLSLEPVEIETRYEDRWVITPERLLSAHREKPLAGLLVANPNNPNGTMMAPGAFKALASTALDNKIRFISDEIYHGLTYDMPEVTALDLDDEIFIINSFSKFFCMTGWRIGWMVVPRSMLETVDRLQQNIFISAPEISQIAACAAFDGMAEMQAVKAGYEKNRSLFLKRLPELGIRAIQPIDGAFYAYCDVTALTNDSAVLASRLLEEANVAITPGLDFDSSRGDSWMRFSFCGDHDEMARAFDRIGVWLEKNGRA